MAEPLFRRREVPAAAASRLLGAGLDPVLARVLAARGIDSPAELGLDLAALHPPSALLGADRAAVLLADAIGSGAKLCVIGDYDCDGATASAVAVRGLRMMGAVVDYLVPNRFEHGYGLSPAIVELAIKHPRLGRPDWLITVDNGITSAAGVAHANAAGLRVIVTDHHLPGEQLPPAAAIVNPNQPGCQFPSKNLCGAGVMFYTLLALRAELRARNTFPGAEPALGELLDLVALGTVADVVRLDRNNRLLVAAGLRRIRSGRANAGIRALLRVAGRDEYRTGSTDLGFTLGPRINAAGRLQDISLGIECLLSDDPDSAARLAGELDGINRQRRGIEQSMREQALDEIGDFDPARLCAVAYRPDWHEGLVGLVAGRLKERLHRPTVALAPASAEPTMLRGSGRSIPGVHLRDVLERVNSIAPGILVRFGGHAMAAGLTIHAADRERFEQVLEEAVTEMADRAAFERELLTDGSLVDANVDLTLADTLAEQIWGQGFPEPLFCDRVEVLGQRVVGGAHLKLDLRFAGKRVDAIAFQRVDPLPEYAEIAYRIGRNEYQGRATIQWLVEAVGTS